MQNSSPDIISIEDAKTLPGLFRKRLNLSSTSIAYRYFDHERHTWLEFSWQDMVDKISRWQLAIKQLSLNPGDRVAIMAGNSPQWVAFEQAALGLGLVVVPLYVNDRPGNVAYILNDANVRLLLLEQYDQWRDLQAVADEISPELSVWCVGRSDNERVKCVADLLPKIGGELNTLAEDANALATIVYTSGTTGRPKGVMLSHRNILWNANAGLRAVKVFSNDTFLSFLPLSHALERTIGYYLPMMCGATVAYCRSVPHLAEDLLTIRPTVLISVPRIYERTYLKINEQLHSPVKRQLFNMAVDTGWQRFQQVQGRASWHPKVLLWPLLSKLVAQKIMAKLGGRLRIAICGGAPMPEHVGKVFIGLGLNLLQGYGMTEFSPVASVNTPESNDPNSVGLPLPEVEAKIGDNEELLLRGPGVMIGYWNNPVATAEVIDEKGWLHTGDKARIEADHIYITGRLKDVIVLANGEKVPPADMEMAIASDALFEQVMVIGDNRPYLTALIVLNEGEANKRGIVLEGAEGQALSLIVRRLYDFPGYAQIRRVTIVRDQWTVENEMLTPTLKLKRNKIMEVYQADVEKMYQRRSS